MTSLITREKEEKPKPQAAAAAARASSKWPRASAEQRTVLDHLNDIATPNTNVVVDAVAGSGKSTLVLLAARERPRLRFLQVTYNAMLRHELKLRAASLGVRNLEIHTFHSLAVKYFNMNGHTDFAMRLTLSQSNDDTGSGGGEEKQQLPVRFDVIVIDECQDMSALYFELMWTFALNMKDGAQFQLLVLGDAHQGIYDFRGADSRFLTQAAEVS